MTAFPKKAMVMAAGYGQRMKPLTDHIPKPLIEVAGKNLIDRALDWLAASGVAEAVVNSGYLAPLLEAHLATRTSPIIHISREETPLETGGGIEKALPMLGTQLFFVVNSDVICLDGKTPALGRLYDAWDDSFDALLLLHKLEDAVGFDGAGDFFLSEQGRLRRRLTAERAPYVFTGVQLLNPRMFQDAPGGVYSLNKLYNKDIATDGTLARVRGLVHDGNWLHVGDPAGLASAEQWLKSH